MNGTAVSKWIRAGILGLLCLLGVLVPRDVAAQTGDSSGGTAASGTTQAQASPTSQDAATLGFFRSTELGGLVDVYYDYFSTKSDALFRNFDTKHNAFALSMAELWVTKAPAADSRTGFKVKFNFGPATSSFIHAAEPGSAQVFENVQEAYASYLAPIGKGLQFDAGIFVTQHGAEVIEAKDNWNYSHSLLFTLAIPYYHSGVRATYVVNDKVTLMGDIVNGWNNVGENNTGKTLGAQIMLKPTAKLSIIQNYMAGPEQARNNDDWRQLADTTVSYAATPTLSLMANYDYGSDSVGGSDVHWQGVAAYAKYQANKWVTLIPRFEYYDDASGFTTGAVQKLKEFTGTIELKAADNFLWRIEYRGDYSDKNAFADDAGKPQKNQHAIVFGLLYAFSSKAQ